MGDGTDTLDLSVDPLNPDLATPGNPYPTDPYLNVAPSASAFSDPSGTGADQVALGEGIVQQSLGQQIVADTQAGLAQEALGRQIVNQATTDWWSAAAGTARAVGNVLPVAAVAGAINGSSVGKPGTVKATKTLWDTYISGGQGITGPQIVVGAVVVALGAYAIHRYS